MDLKTSLKSARQTVVDSFSPADGTDVLESLKKDHDAVKAMLKELVQSDSAPRRKTLVKQIKTALIPHARAEEKVVYDAVLALKGENYKVDGHEGYLEHELADKTLLKLSKIAQAKSPEFSATAKVLKELLEHHISEEERNIWADLKANFDAEARAAMNRQFQAAKKKVKVPA